MTALDAAALRRTLDPARLPFRSTAEVEALDGISGQPRAEEALACAYADDPMPTRMTAECRQAPSVARADGAARGAA